jgi:hypothetical protein
MWERKWGFISTSTDFFLKMAQLQLPELQAVLNKKPNNPIELV